MMSKNFYLRQAAHNGRIDISIWKIGGGDSGVGRGWYIDVPSDKLSSVAGRILDIMGAADSQPDFKSAEKLIDERFSALCKELGCPLSP
jgi:hypothetical protein